MKSKVSALVLVLMIVAQPALAVYQAFDDPSMSTHPFIADSVARTVSWNTPIYSCPSGSAAFFLNITAGTTLLIQIGVQFQDPATGTWIDYAIHTAATGVGLTGLIISPQQPAVSAFNVSLAKMPPVFRIRMYHNNANSATYTVGGFCY